MENLDSEKKLVDLHIFYGSSVFRKLKKFKVVYPMLSCIIGAYYTHHNVFKGYKSIKEIRKQSREEKVC